MWPRKLQFNQELVFQDLKYRGTLFPSFPFNTSSFILTKICIKSNQASKQTRKQSSDWLSINHVISLKPIRMSTWRKYLNWKVGPCVLQWQFYNKWPQTPMWKLIIHFAYGFCKSTIQTEYGKEDLCASLDVQTLRRRWNTWSLPYSHAWRLMLNEVKQNRYLSYSMWSQQLNSQYENFRVARLLTVSSDLQNERASWELYCIFFFLT